MECKKLCFVNNSLEATDLRYITLTSLYNVHYIIFSHVTIIIHFSLLISFLYHYIETTNGLIRLRAEVSQVL